VKLFYSSGSGQGPVAGSCEHGNKTSGSIKSADFLDRSSDSWLLKKDPAPWSLLVISPLLPLKFKTRTLGPTKPPSLGVKRPGREADYSPPFNAEVKECAELFLHSSISLHGVVLG
jgi:hypothetical protein